MPRRIHAETSSPTASTSRATGAPSRRIRAPATPGPATSAPELASAFLACASTRRSRSTTCVSTTCAAEPAMVKMVPMKKPTAYIHGMDNQPIQYARGTLATATASRLSPTM
jgi:hypothetical protein